MKFLIMILVLFFGLSGCSGKTAPHKELSLKQDKTMTQNDMDDDFAEFEEEIKIQKRSDPFSGFNRVMTAFNDKAYRYVLSPISRGYKATVHKDIRKSVGNFFHNILFPIRFINNLLQLKFKNSLEETERFVINSTIGFLGLIDVAREEFNITPHNEDFGQTLGYWGVGSGYPVVWPFFGPSNLRDSVGLFSVDSYLNPTTYSEDKSYNLVDNYGKSIAVKVGDKVNYISLHEGEYEKFTDGAVDLYPMLQDAYEQYREKQIKE